MADQTMTALGARRLLMGGLGLLGSPQRRVGPATLYRQIENMGFVQIDTISAVVRAHQHILFTRFHGYRPEMLKRLTERERRLFEHWTHDASLIPSRWLKHWKRRFENSRGLLDRYEWWRKRMGPQPEKVIGHVRRRVAEEGPLFSRDFQRRPEHAGSWWRWKPQKTALEYLWRCGELLVSRRVNFQKAFDLAERVHPELPDLPTPGEENHLDWACRTALERLGSATPAELAAFWDGVGLEAAQSWRRKALREKRVVEVRVESEDGSPPRSCVAFPDWKRRLANLPPPPKKIRLLNPFDPVIRDRQRCRRLFGFDYRLEAFVPKAKRRYGYYVLPILKGDRLIGRLDAKLRRRRELLEVKALWWENESAPGAALLRELDEALERLAVFGGARGIDR